MNVSSVPQNGVRYIEVSAVKHVPYGEVPLYSKLSSATDTPSLHFKNQRSLFTKNSAYKRELTITNANYSVFKSNKILK